MTLKYPKGASYAGFFDFSLYPPHIYTVLFLLTFCFADNATVYTREVSYTLGFQLTY